MRFKLTGTVGNNNWGNTELGYPSFDKCLYHCFCRSISDGDSFGPPGETVNAGEEVRKTSWWRQQSNQVNMNYLKTSFGSEKRWQWRSYMMLYLRMLALHTRACPTTNIGIDARPYIASSNELLGCLYRGCDKQWIESNITYCHAKGHCLPVEVSQ